MKDIHLLFDESQSNLRELMCQGLKTLPKKYHDPNSTILVDI